MSADLQPQLADGSDLGAVDETRARGRAATHDGRVPQKPPPEIIRLLKYRSWTKACNGNPALVQSDAFEFALPRHECRGHLFRTTWALVDQKRYQLELAIKWNELSDMLVLPGFAQVLVTIFHPSKDIDLTPFMTTTTDLVPLDLPDPSKCHTRAPAVRHRRTFAEASVGTEHPADWSRFNVGKSLKALSVGNPDTQMRELRKLHLRWWHASKQAMRQVLQPAGLPNSVLDKIPQVIDTCRECRQWSRPAHETIPTLRMTTRFNEHVEADILFYREFAVFH